MRAPILASILVAWASSPALAAVQSYDAVCQSTCVASDGSSQPAGTALYRFAWDGKAAFTPRDAAGNALNATLDVAQSTSLYQPTSPITAPVPGPILSSVSNADGSLSFVNAQDGSSVKLPVIPSALPTIPPAASSAGQVGSDTAHYVPGGAVAPSGTRSTATMTTATGTFSVTWAVPLASATPVANVIPVNGAATAPIVCNLTAQPTPTTVTGKCWQGTVGFTLPSLASSLPGFVQTLFSASAANVPIEVIAREVSQ